MTGMSTKAARELAPVDRRLRVVLFSGGSGTETITGALLKQSRINLTIVINAYDDGHSTGRLRRFIPGMLGPSDVRKNIARLMPRQDQCHRALRELSDYRLPKGFPHEAGRAEVERWARGDLSQLPAGRLFEDLNIRQARQFQHYCEAFLAYSREQDRVGRAFDYDDCAVGNILFAGCFLRAGRDFNQAMEDFGRFYEVEARLLNITQGENLFLVATRADGSLIRGEAELVAATANTSPISDLFLLPEAVFREEIEAGRARSPEEIRAALAQARTPHINPEADAAIRAADVIIYGPGTQHSSLFPSYLTEGVGEAILANSTADKVFIANIQRDHDIPSENANDLARKLLETMRRQTLDLAWKDVVTHFFFQQTGSGGARAEGYVPFDPATFHFPLETVKLRDWESQDGKHAGGYVLAELQQIVQSRMQISLAPLLHLVSIVVPALNEERTVAEVLKQLTALDFSAHDLGKEIILVDGGSTDATLERARSVRGVRVFRLPAGSRGRGATLRHGLDQARGDVVVFFPADAEYDATDIYAVVDAVVRQEAKAVYGTRAIRWSDPDERLRQVYRDSGLLYLLSKYGGMLLSTVTLFLFNRYVTDTLTSLKAVEGTLIRSLDLRGEGIDFDMELVAKLSRRREYILEIPVAYHPRGRAEGKKTTIGDGLRAIAALLRHRFRG
jgi:2-phospho-L-lactate transferase/gluconeogenesis factor (CofD/UPF0052 family)